MKKIFRGIQNLIAYAKLIWNDRDYDHAFLYQLLSFKLSRMEKFFASPSAQRMDADEISAAIGACRDALERVMNDNYLEDEVEAFDKKWGVRCCPNCGGLFCDCFPVYGGNGKEIIAHKLVLEYPNALNEEQRKAAREEALELAVRQQDCFLDDMERAFDIIARCSSGWWD